MDSFKTDSSMKKSDSYRSKIADAKPPIKKIHKKFRLENRASSEMIFQPI